ncbi:hypothetical protein HYPSUDRAFT_44288 [Hypholoma sublateritium FD-334 SS-4]|uniref:Uncharacterized protein n=1 Tax=Hypholoma sublateritium (strain FD-334 SS-4) TaxID=945553 RepID=A0A0D2NS72_HYPSF|nr:hypothetical protein HYPSUDRAFT_44288 [Hypholoma sublateritium FD-334 SS-4]
MPLLVTPSSKALKTESRRKAVNQPSLIITSTAILHIHIRISTHHHVFTRQINTSAKQSCFPEFYIAT